MGTFDPASFLDITVTEANATQTVPIPVNEYVAVVDGEPEIRQWNSRDGTKSGLALDITWSLDDPGLKALLGRDKVTVRQGIILDINESGGLETGKGRNVNLGRLREALDLNRPGVPFNFRQLAGKVAKIKIEHRVDGENVYADVKGVARLAA